MCKDLGLLTTLPLKDRPLQTLPWSQQWASGIINNEFNPHALHEVEFRVRLGEGQGRTLGESGGRVRSGGGRESGNGESGG